MNLAIYVADTCRASLLQPHNLVRSFKALLRRSHIGEIRFHDLRRLFVGQLARKRRTRPDGDGAGPPHQRPGHDEI